MVSVMTDLMVDVETTGTNAQYAGVIQIGALPFNYETQEIGTPFNRCLSMAPNRFWSESTRQWWGRQKRTVLEDILRRAEDPAVVFRDFHQYVCGFDNPVRFWAKPLSFDWPMISTHMEQFDLAMPFRYHEARDMRSHISGLHGQGGNVDMDHITAVGDAHNALFDCVLQLKQLFAAINGEWH